MLSFIRKRLPSKDRRPAVAMQKSESDKDLHIDRTKKKKSKKSIDELVCGPAVSPSNERVNQSYSEVDYFPMMPRHVQAKRISQSSHTLSDSYFNPSELLEGNRSPSSPTNTSKGPVIDIPIVFVDKDTERRHYQDIDHQRTRALNDISELRGVQRIISHPFRVNGGS